MKHEHGDKVNVRTRAMLEARLYGPLSVLGRRRHGDHYDVGVFESRANEAWLKHGARWEVWLPEYDGVFKWSRHATPHERYQMSSALHERRDAYTLPSGISRNVLYLFGEDIEQCPPQSHSLLQSSFHCSRPRVRRTR